MGSWNERRLDEMITVNPNVKLEKERAYAFIDIDKVTPSQKYVSNVEERVFTGQGGSRFRNGDTVFSRITPCLENRKIAEVRLPNGGVGIGSTEFFVFRNKAGITDAKFVYYFVSSDWVVKPAINSMTGASGRQRADRKFIASRTFMFPNFEEQTRIGEVLSAYDDAIENNNRRIILLEKAAQELYKEWFVRFRFPGYEGTKFVNGIPEGWEVVKLGNHVRIKGGKRLPQGESLVSTPTEHPYIRIRDVSNNKFVNLTDAFLYLEDKTYEQISKFTVKHGDVLISIVGTIGALAQVGRTLHGANLTENCVKLIEPKRLTLSYIYHFLNSEAGAGAIRGGIVGASQPKLPFYNIERIKLLKPHDELINRFSEQIESLDTQLVNIFEQSQNLARQRDLLLPRLMSGKLEV